MAKNTKNARIGNVADIAPGRSMNEKPSLIAELELSADATVSQKVQATSEIRQRLAEASDLLNEGSGAETEARRLSGIAATRLYQGRTDGWLSPDEVSAILGDVFGRDKKKDGTDSKTPSGMGATIRKRVERAVNAAEFATGGSPGTFFKGVDRDQEVTVKIDGQEETVTVNSTLARMEAGDISIFTAYDTFQKIKSASATRLNPAFDPKKVMAMTDALTGETAPELFASNPALVRAYSELLKVVANVDEAGARWKADHADDETDTGEAEGEPSGEGETGPVEPESNPMPNAA